MLLNCGVGEDSWESLGLTARRSNQSILKESVLYILRKDWCWSWNSNTLATWCKELTHWKRPWCWERLKAGGEGDNRVWDSWMASLTQWTWVWAIFRSWGWTRKPGVLQSMGSQRVRHDWATKLNRRTMLPSAEVGSNFVYFCRASVKLDRNCARFSSSLWVISWSLSIW